MALVVIRPTIQKTSLLAQPTLQSLSTLLVVELLSPEFVPSARASMLSPPLKSLHLSNASTSSPLIPRLHLTQERLFRHAAWQSPLSDRISAR